MSISFSELEHSGKKEKGQELLGIEMCMDVSLVRSIASSLVTNVARGTHPSQPRKGTITYLRNVRSSPFARSSDASNLLETKSIGRSYRFSEHGHVSSISRMHTLHEMTRIYRGLNVGTCNEREKRMKESN